MNSSRDSVLDAFRSPSQRARWMGTADSESASTQPVETDSAPSAAGSPKAGVDSREGRGGAPKAVATSDHNEVFDRVTCETVGTTERVTTSQKSDFCDAAPEHDLHPDTVALIGRLNRQAAGVDAPQEPATAEPAPASSHWIPALEVDRFRWPQLVDSILDAVSEGFEQLVRRMARDAAAHGPLLVVSGREPQSGATTIALALARLCCRRGTSVAMVDAHFAAPQLATQLGVRPTVCWTAALCGEVPVDEVLVESLEDHATLGPLRGDASVGQPAAGSAKFWQELREHYDVVLVDAGPLDATLPEVSQLLGQERWDLLVVERDANGTDCPTSATLASCGAASVGIVQNFVRG